MEHPLANVRNDRPAEGEEQRTPLTGQNREKATGNRGGSARNEKQKKANRATVGIVCSAPYLASVTCHKKKRTTDGEGNEKGAMGSDTGHFFNFLRAKPLRCNAAHACNLPATCLQPAASSARLVPCCGGCSEGVIVSTLSFLPP